MDKEIQCGGNVPRLEIADRVPKVLLCGVFGPYGVDDEFGRKENIMELFHNQVTKAQEDASFRFHHRSFGLYFIAENIKADVTVLDFPSRRRFIKEIRQGYDVIGISFIAPNYIKAKEMASLIRKHSPGTKIVLGGHGVAIEGVEKLIDCDHVARGEGISWFREFLGQDTSAPIKHPLLPANDTAKIFGVPLPGPQYSLLVPGVGCVNGCRFCATSHFFGKTYTPFLKTGRDVFETCCRIADARGIDEFGVMDENFLKDHKRVTELLAEMEKHNRWFMFRAFSSAEAINAFGIDNLVRLGIDFVWIGVEGQNTGGYIKNAGNDPTKMVKDLRDRGISVLASGILCAEHHTQENVNDEIDFMVNLNADMVQFMLLTAMPVTQLYKDFAEQGVLQRILPYEEWHGQKMLNYEHPEFPGNEADRIMKLAFRREYEVNNSSAYRVSETALRGYKWLSAIKNRDACLNARLEHSAKKTKMYCQLLPLVARYAVSEREREMAIALDKERTAILGPPDAAERCRRFGAEILSGIWATRRRLCGDMFQPPTIVTRYKRP